MDFLRTSPRAIANWLIVFKRSEQTSIIRRCFKRFVAKIVLTQQEWLKLELASICQKEESF